MSVDDDDDTCYFIQPQGCKINKIRMTDWLVDLIIRPKKFNPLKGSGVRWLHFEVFNAIQV